MADMSMHPRVMKLMELEQSGRIKPEHQQELERYRMAGVVKADKALTELQSKGASFLTRAIGANKEYSQAGVGARSFVGQVLADNAPNALNSLPGFIGNSPNRQRADSAQDEFIAASLRMDSGAAIPEEEMDRQRRIYFPMPGEEAPVRAQKARARLRAIAGLRISAGPMAGKAEAIGDELSGATEGEGVQQPQRGDGNVPKAAIAMLKAKPQLAADFDAKYGQGASERYLGGK